MDTQNTFDSYAFILRKLSRATKIYDKAGRNLQDSIRVEKHKIQHSKASPGVQLHLVKA